MTPTGTAQQLSMVKIDKLDDPSFVLGQTRGIG